MKPFEFINDVSYDKKDLTRTMEGSIKFYNSFLTNRAFSHFPETIFYANEMNRNSELGEQYQHDFWLTVLPKRKRFSKWNKTEKDEDLLAVSEFYNVSLKVAKDYLKILTTDDLIEIRTIINMS